MAVPSFIGALGQGDATFSCVTGYDVWVTPGTNALSYWFYAGVCPASGVITPLQSMLPSGKTIYAQMTTVNLGPATATSYQASSYASGAGGGGAGSQVTGELTIKPFEYTSAQQSEIYTAMVVVFAAGLGALALIWGLRQLRRIFGTYAGSSE